MLERVARALAGGLRRRVAPDHARVARVRAHEHRRSLGVRPAGRRALPDPARRRRARARGSTGSSTSCSRTAGVDSVEKTKEIPITMVESGPASGFWGAAELGRLIGEPNVLALDIGGTTAKCSLIEGGHVTSDLRLLDRAQPAARPATRSWSRSSTSSRSGTAAAASPGSTTSGSCTSGRSLGRRGSRARRPTAAAAPRRRRPTRTSRSAGSTATTSAAARSTPTWRPSAGRSTRSPAGSGSTAPRRRAASSGSRTTTWSTRSS